MWRLNPAKVSPTPCNRWPWALAGLIFILCFFYATNTTQLDQSGKGESQTTMVAAMAGLLFLNTFFPWPTNQNISLLLLSCMHLETNKNAPHASDLNSIKRSTLPSPHQWMPLDESRNSTISSQTSLDQEYLWMQMYCLAPSHCLHLFPALV